MATQTNGILGRLQVLGRSGLGAPLLLLTILAMMVVPLSPVVLDLAFTFNNFSFSGPMAVLGMGAWLGTIMLFNVWVLIWPNQKKILGLDGKEHSADAIASAKKVALLASRTNTALSIPMLLCMVGFAHGL